jgi:F0F1-type ATP synthase membrane subunit b/b'
MVIQASEQVLGRTVDHDEHERLVAQALDDLEAEVAGGSAGNGSRTA